MALLGNVSPVQFGFTMASGVRDDFSRKMVIGHDYASSPIPGPGPLPDGN